MAQQITISAEVVSDTATVLINEEVSAGMVSEAVDEDDYSYLDQVANAATQ